MGARVMEPGRYAQHPDGSWHMFTDKAALPFKPVAVVTVKAPGSAANPAPAPDPAAEPEISETPATAGDSAVNVPVVAAPPKRRREVKAPRTLQYASPRSAPPKCTIIDNSDDSGARRTATPGDVFRAVADQFGILPAMGQHRSCARFKPLVRRDPDAEAAAAYDRAIQDRQAKR